MPREKLKWHKPQGERTDAEHWDGPSCTSDEAGNAVGAKGTGQAAIFASNWRQEEMRDGSKTVHHSEATGV